MKNILFLLSAVVLPLFSAEYFLSPGQKALPLLKKLRPGDVLTVRKGLHPPVGEIIRIKGAPGKPIVIRGEDPDLSLFSPWNTGKKLQWSKTPGKKYLWETPLAREAAGVCDPEAGEVFICAPSVETMDFFRNTFFYDKKNKKLYVHTPDGGKPSEKLQTALFSGHIFELEGAEYLIIKDLSFAGSAHKVPRLSALGAAIRTRKTRHITIDNCRFYFNSGGVNITAYSEDTIVRNCFFRKNISIGYSEMAQLFFGQFCKRSLAENNLIVDGSTHGLRFYAGAADCTALNNTVVNERMGIYFKASKAPRRAEGNVAVNCTDFSFSDLQGGRPIRARNNIFEKNCYMQTDEVPYNLIFPSSRAPLFCAPEFYDFRLQGKVYTGGKSAVLYVAPGGNDRNSGLLAAQPLKTPAGAFKKLSDMGSCYIGEGEYDSLVISKPLVLRGRGRVTIGKLLVTAPDVEIENITVRQLILRKAPRVKVKRCAVSQLTMKHSPGGEVYRSRIGQRQCDTPLRREIFSSALPYAAEPDGPRQPERPAPPAVVENLQIAALYHDSALICWETPNVSCDSWRQKGPWWTPHPVAAFLEYGTTPECREQVPSTGELFHSINLYALRPGTRYYYRVRIPDRPFALGKGNRLFPCPLPGYARLWEKGITTPVKSFVTPARSEITSRVLPVRPGELTRASALARPGDTLLLAPGIYNEVFKPLASGKAGAPIVLKSQIPGKAVLDGRDHLLPGGVVLESVSHIVIDGVTFRHFANQFLASRGGMGYGQMQLSRASNIEVRNCRFFGTEVYQFLISLRECGKVKIENNVFLGGVTEISGGNNKELSILNNTFYAPSIKYMLLIMPPNGKLVIRKNLFLGQSEQKAKGGVSLLAVEVPETSGARIELDHNVWYFSPGNKIRYCGLEKFAKFPAAMGRAGVARLRKMTGFEKYGKEIEKFQFRDGRFVDPFNWKKFTVEVVKPLSRGILPETGAFVPRPAPELEGIGADDGTGASAGR